MSKITKTDVDRIAAQHATIALTNLPTDPDARQRIITGAITSAIYKAIDILRGAK